MIPYATEPTPRRPSPAVSFIGRKNSGKTTLVVRVIEELCTRGLDIAAIKHHGHPDFTVDITGKDSYRHREAGARTTTVLSDTRFALMADLDRPLPIEHVLAMIPGHDLVIAEGFRNEGLPAFELMRQANERDHAAADRLRRTLETEAVPTLTPDNPGLPDALVTDMQDLAATARAAGLPVFEFDDIAGICNAIEQRYTRPALTIAVQAGGESTRMGRSKALVPFLGRPLIEHMVDLVAAYADEIIVTTNEAERLEFLVDRHPQLKLVPDIIKTRGALPGLLTALHNSSNELTGVIACDMIAFSPQILSYEAYALKRSGNDAIVPVHQGYREPFASVYCASTCEPVCAQLLDQGASRVQELFDAVSCEEFDGTSFQHRGSLNPFANVNTPEELEQAEILYRLYG